MATRKKKETVAKLPVGRPSKNTPELRKEIADRLSKGEPLAQICRDEWMPHASTVRDWMDADADFSRAIAHAREIGFDAIAQDCLTIADDGRNDFVAARAADGDEAAMKYDADHVQRSKLRVETRLKLLAKWDPKRYGDKLDITAAVTTSTLTDEQLMERATALGAKLGIVKA